MRNFDPLNLASLTSARKQDLLRESQLQAILDDPADVDPELIAACAEGRLSDTDHQKAMLEIASSPAALDMYLTLKQSQPVASAWMTEFPAIAQSVAALPSSTGAVAARTAPPTQVRSQRLALAACVLMALGSGLAMYTQQARLERVRTQLLAQQQEIAAQRTKLLDLQLMTRKASAMTLAAQQGMGWLAGRLGPDLLRASVLQYSGSRGAEDAAPQPLPAELDLWQKSIQELRSSGDSAKDADIEDAFRLLTTLSLTVSIDPAADTGLSPEEIDGHFAPAEQAIQKLLQEFPSDPKVLNLDAVLLLTKYDASDSEQRSVLQAAASEKLRHIVSQYPQHDEALLNLGLLALRSESGTMARPLLEQFISQSQDPALVETVRQILQMIPE